MATPLVALLGILVWIAPMASSAFLKEKRESEYSGTSEQYSRSFCNNARELQQCCSEVPIRFERIPSFLKTCKMSVPDFPICSRDSVQGLFDQLSIGLPEINIPPLDPLLVPEIRILQGDGPVSVTAKLNSVRVTGFSGAKVINNSVDPETYSFVTRLHVPKLRIEGDYSLRGRILLIPLVGHGDCWFEPRGLEVVSSHDIKLKMRENRNFFELKSIKVNFKLGGLKMRMNNLFDGVKALEESTNAYINANWRPVADSLHPILTKTIQDLLFSVLHQLFDNVPAEFFIEDVVIPKKS